MAESLIQLKKSAVALGMDKSKAQGADRAMLEAFVSSMKAASAAPAKKRKTQSAAPVKKKATNSASTSAPAKKSTTGQAKRPTTAAGTSKATTTKTQADSNGDVGRAKIGTVKYNDYDEDTWKPREGSPVDVIFRSLRKHKDNVEKVFEDLKPTVYDFVGKTKKDGTKRSKAEALNMLHYRILRTRFEFAVKTGQHKVATNRIAYGTGEHAQATKAAQKAQKTAAKKKTAAAS